MSFTPGNDGKRGKRAQRAQQKQVAKDAHTAIATTSSKSSKQHNSVAQDDGDIELGDVNTKSTPLLLEKNPSEIVSLEAHEEEDVRNGVFTVVKRGAQASVVRVLRTGGAVAGMFGGAPVASCIAHSTGAGRAIAMSAGIGVNALVLSISGWLGYRTTIGRGDAEQIAVISARILDEDWRAYSYSAALLQGCARNDANALSRAKDLCVNKVEAEKLLTRDEKNHTIDKDKLPKSIADIPDLSAVFHDMDVATMSKNGIQSTDTMTMILEYAQDYAERAQEECKMWSEQADVRKKEKQHVAQIATKLKQMTREIFSAKCKLGGLVCAAVVGAAAGAFQSYEVTDEEKSDAWKVALGQVGICFAAGAAMRAIDCVSMIYRDAHDFANALMVQKMLEEAKDKNIRLNTQRVTTAFGHEIELAHVLDKEKDTKTVSAGVHAAANATVAGASGLVAGAAAAGTAAGTAAGAAVERAHSTINDIRSRSDTEAFLAEGVGMDLTETQKPGSTFIS